MDEPLRPASDAAPLHTPLDLSSFDRVRHQARIATTLLQMVLAAGAAYVAYGMPGGDWQWKLFAADAVLCLVITPFMFQAHRQGDQRWAEQLGFIVIAARALAVLQRVAFAYHGPILADPLNHLFRPICAFVPFVQVAAMVVLRGKNALNLCVAYWLAVCGVILSGLYQQPALHLQTEGVVLLLLWLLVGNPLFLMMLYALPRSEDLVRASARELHNAREQTALLHRLEESEGRFRAFMANSPAITWLKDEAGRYLFANPAFERHFSLAPESWRGRTDFDFLPEAFARACRNAELSVIVERVARSSVGPASDADGLLREWLLVRFPVQARNGEVYIGGVATDVTERRRLERALADSQAQVKQLMDDSPVLVWMKDAQGRYTYLSRSYEQRFQLKGHQLLGKTDAEWWPPKVAAAFAAADAEVLSSGKTLEAVESAPDPDGQIRFWWVFKFPFQNSAGERFVGGVGVDITERKRAEERIKLESLTDELTGVYNRRGFFTLGEQEFRAIQRSKQAVAVMFADIDGLKIINDSYGHAAGDEAITAAAAALRVSVRNCDIIGRLGGDEFAVLAINCANTDEIQRRLHEQVDSFNQSGSRAWRLSLTLGSFLADASQMGDFAAFVAEADSKMYAAKKARQMAMP